MGPLPGSYPMGLAWRLLATLWGFCLDGGQLGQAPSRASDPAWLGNASRRSRGCGWHVPGLAGSAVPGASPPSTSGRHAVETAGSGAVGRSFPDTPARPPSQLQAQKLRLAYTRSSHYGGSLPNVNQIGCGLAEFQVSGHRPRGSTGARATSLADLPVSSGRAPCTRLWIRLGALGTTGWWNGCSETPEGWCPRCAATRATYPSRDRAGRGGGGLRGNLRWEGLCVRFGPIRSGPPRKATVQPL